MSAREVLETIEVTPEEEAQFRAITASMPQLTMTPMPTGFTVKVVHTNGFACFTHTRDEALGFITARKVARAIERCDDVEAVVVLPI